MHPLAPSAHFVLGNPFDKFMAERDGRPIFEAEGLERMGHQKHPSVDKRKKSI